ncbi:MAG: ImmA/IrrE family metallo-endopeptidase [Actinomycetota bacterium]|jgi:Zn-dependent peptidase ImmA (M78 family)
MVRLLERHGIVVARLASGHEKIDAFSVPFEDRPVVMMSAAKGKKDRSRYDVAHELGHLVMHEPGERATKRAEDQAQQLAAEFLMPAEAIRRELPTEPNWDQLIALKRRWHVSMAALLYRARTLHVMEPDIYLQAMKALSARGWRRHEPADLGTPESPLLLRKAMDVAELDEDELADRTAIPRRLLRQILDLAGDSRPRVVI